MTEPSAQSGNGSLHQSDAHSPASKTIKSTNQTGAVRSPNQSDDMKSPNLPDTMTSPYQSDVMKSPCQSPNQSDTMKTPTQPDVITSPNLTQTRVAETLITEAKTSTNEVETHKYESKVTKSQTQTQSQTQPQLKSESESKVPKSARNSQVKETETKLTKTSNQHQPQRQSAHKRQSMDSDSKVTEGGVHISNAHQGVSGENNTATKASTTEVRHAETSATDETRGNCDTNQTTVHSNVVDNNNANNNTNNNMNIKNNTAVSSVSESVAETSSIESSTMSETGMPANATDIYDSETRERNNSNLMRQYNTRDQATQNSSFMRMLHPMGPGDADAHSNRTNSSRYSKPATDNEKDSWRNMCSCTSAYHAMQSVIQKYIYGKE